MFYFSSPIVLEIEREARKPPRAAAEAESNFSLIYIYTIIYK